VRATTTSTTAYPNWLSIHRQPSDEREQTDECGDFDLDPRDTVNNATTRRFRGGYGRKDPEGTGAGTLSDAY
jgi:hypothetical protein